MIFGAVFWLALITVAWAVRPLEDSVPVGIDQTAPPARLVSQRVGCNSLFAGSPRPDEPLPVLTPQPPGVQPLSYHRTPCLLARDQARLAFGLNIAVAALVVAAGVALLTRRHEHEAPAMPTAVVAG
jgi:hypothetical protein